MKNRKYIILFVAALVLSACAAGQSTSPAEDASTASIENGAYSGYYRASRETSSFAPCPEHGEPETLPGYGVGYWLDSTPESKFIEMYDAIVAQSIPQDREGVIVFIRVEGNLSPESGQGYGHLGKYSRAITVTKTLEMIPYAEGQCASK